MEQISSELSGLRSQLALASKLEARSRLKKFIADKAAKNRPTRIVELVRSLQTEIEAWKADKQAVLAEVRAFDSELEDIAIGAARLQPPVELEYAGVGVQPEEQLGTFEARGSRLFDQVAQAISARLLPGELIPADRRAYRALPGKNFGMYGMNVRGGEIVYFTPEHAADFVTAGLLEEVAPAIAEEAAPAAV
jgi:hypothetical protein